jgi:hypothetical protein
MKMFSQNVDKGVNINIESSSSNDSETKSKSSRSSSQEESSYLSGVDAFSENTESEF